MSVSLDLPQVRKMIGELATRIGILERRTNPASARSGSGHHDGVGAHSVSITNSADSADATGARSIAVGYSPTASGDDSIAIGPDSGAYGTGAVSLGFSADSDPYGVAVGSSANAQDDAVGIGHTANASGLYSVALGVEATATGSGAVALGNTAQASDTYAAALGDTTLATHEASVAIGYQAETTHDYQIVLGAVGHFVEVPGNGIVLHSPNGTRWRVTVTNGGALNVATA